MTIESFFEALPDNQQVLALKIHHWLKDELELKAKIRYKLPFYDQKSWICYLFPTGNEGIELAFVRGNELSNVQGILESKGSKQVKSILIDSENPIPWKILHEIIQEALWLDETIPYSLKK